MRRRAGVAVLLALLGLAGVVAGVGSMAPGRGLAASSGCGPDSANPWTGTWNSSYGTMTLTQCRTTLSGDYAFRNGHLHGTVEGNVFTGTWDQDPSHKPPSDAGSVQFTLSADGKSFTGKWRNGSTGDWHTDWNGTLEGDTSTGGSTTSTAATSTAATSTAATTSPADESCPAGKYCVFILTNVADPGNIWVGQSSDLKGKLTCDFTDGGLCKGAGGSDTPVTYDVKSPAYASCAAALAFYKQNAKDPHAAFGGTKVYIFGGSYFVDNETDWCTASGSSSPTRPLATGSFAFAVDAPVDFNLAIAPTEAMYLARKALNRYRITGHGKISKTSNGYPASGSVSFIHDRKIGADENLTLDVTGSQAVLAGPSQDESHPAAEDIQVKLDVRVARSDSASCPVGRAGKIFVHELRPPPPFRAGGQPGRVVVFLCGETLAFSTDRWAFGADDRAVIVVFQGGIFPS